MTNSYNFILVWRSFILNTVKHKKIWIENHGLYLSLFPYFYIVDVIMILIMSHQGMQLCMQRRLCIIIFAWLWAIRLLVENNGIQCPTTIVNTYNLPFKHTIIFISPFYLAIFPNFIFLKKNDTSCWDNLQTNHKEN